MLLFALGFPLCSGVEANKQQSPQAQIQASDAANTTLVKDAFHWSHVHMIIALQLAFSGEESRLNMMIFIENRFTSFCIAGISK